MAALERAALTAEGSVLEAGHFSTLYRSRDRRATPSLKQRAEEAHRRSESLQRELDALRATTIAAEPIWLGRGYSTVHDYCFILMPFSAKHNLQTVYQQHVRPPILNMGLRCKRADDIYGVCGVMKSVWEGINRARVVVADLTGWNANVFYELGIAHTLGKPVIMLTQGIDYVPFDLRHLRCIVYSYTPPGVAKLEDSLARTLATVLSHT